MFKRKYHFNYYRAVHADYRLLFAIAVLALFLICKAFCHVVELHPKLPSEIYEEWKEEQELNEGITINLEINKPATEEEIEDALIFAYNE